MLVVGMVRLPVHNKVSWLLEAWVLVECVKCSWISDRWAASASMAVCTSSSVSSPTPHTLQSGAVLQACKEERRGKMKQLFIFLRPSLVKRGRVQ